MLSVILDAGTEETIVTGSMEEANLAAVRVASAISAAAVCVKLPDTSEEAEDSVP